ncbi:hypothetical protein DFH11DRAFT_1584403 [Phellopilus nigrolimitatus]|nr:hypothetical protein DFH11DRAFT_1584403 [Phellopilus nigrolimitatus]
MSSSRTSSQCIKRMSFCDDCNKIYSSTEIERHRLIHDPNAPRYPCPYEGCNYAPLQYYNLKHHILSTHEKIARMKCRATFFCEESFRCYGTRVNHELREHGYCHPVSATRSRVHWLVEQHTGAETSTTGNFKFEDGLVELPVPGAAPAGAIGPAEEYSTLQIEHAAKALLRLKYARTVSDRPHSSTHATIPNDPRFHDLNLGVPGRKPAASPTNESLRSSSGFPISSERLCSSSGEFANPCAERQA